VLKSRIIPQSKVRTADSLIMLLRASCNARDHRCTRSKQTERMLPDVTTIFQPETPGVY
jgi:hypothetical protein